MRKITLYFILNLYNLGCYSVYKVVILTAINVNIKENKLKKDKCHRRLK